MVERTVIAGPPLRVEYELSQMGRELEPALAELQRWANRWLGERQLSRPPVAAERARPGSRALAGRASK